MSFRRASQERHKRSPYHKGVQTLEIQENKVCFKKPGTLYVKDRDRPFGPVSGVCVCVGWGGGGGGGESRKTCIKRIFARTIQAKK